MLRIATYNVFEGGHRRLGTVADRPSKLTAAVAGLAPDVIALQELVGWQERGRASFNEFAAATGLEGELFVGNGFPLALLARPPWRISGARFISNGLWHGIISARLEGGAGRPVQVIAIHLPPRSPDQRLGEIETALSQITGDLPVVLLGDMNLISPPRRRPAGRTGAGHVYPTFQRRCARYARFQTLRGIRLSRCLPSLSTHRIRPYDPDAGRRRGSVFTGAARLHFSIRRDCRSESSGHSSTAPARPGWRQTISRWRLTSLATKTVGQSPTAKRCWLT